MTVENPCPSCSSAVRACVTNFGLELHGVAICNPPAGLPLLSFAEHPAIKSWQTDSSSRAAHHTHSTSGFAVTYLLQADLFELVQCHATPLPTLHVCTPSPRVAARARERQPCATGSYRGLPKPCSASPCASDGERDSLWVRPLLSRQNELFRAGCGCLLAYRG